MARADAWHAQRERRRGRRPTDPPTLQMPRPAPGPPTRVRPRFFFFHAHAHGLTQPTHTHQPPPQIEQINAEQLETALADRDRPLVIDFFATWCGPCLLLAKELETVAADLGDAVRIVKIDVDANDELAGALQIQGLPTLVFVGLDPAKPALRTEGLLPASAIKQIIEEELE